MHLSRKHSIFSGSLGSLKELYLHDNKIGDAGMAAFAGAISSGSLPALGLGLYMNGNPGSDAPVNEALGQRFSEQGFSEQDL